MGQGSRESRECCLTQFCGSIGQEGVFSSSGCGVWGGVAAGLRPQHTTLNLSNPAPRARDTSSTELAALRTPAPTVYKHLPTDALSRDLARWTMPPSVSSAGRLWSVPVRQPPIHTHEQRHGGSGAAAGAGLRLCAPQHNEGSRERKLPQSLLLHTVNWRNPQAPGPAVWLSRRTL